MADYTRSTAKICNIKDLVNGEFIKKEGWDPSYVICDYGKLMRINILGVLVSKNSNDLILDDGTGKIIVRDFTKQIEPDIGDLVIVIGKPRLFNEELFVNTEIIKKVKNKKWIEYRKKLLASRKKEQVEKESNYIEDSSEKKVVEEKMSEKEFDEKKQEASKEMSNAEKIISLIDKFDTGDGADLQKVISELNILNAEKLIQALMEEGEIFQVKPGRLKVM